MPRVAAKIAALLFGLLAFGAASLGAAAQLAGTYVPGGAHPFVFADAARYDGLLANDTLVVRSGLHYLEQRAAEALTRRAELTDAYSGCDLDVYVRRFSLEQDSATRAAADLALYAYLAGRGKGYGRPETAAAATALARDILLSWARRGLREGGAVRTDPRQFCEKSGAAPLDVGLQIGRGMAHWVMAQDLLLALGAFSAIEQRELDVFLDDIGRLMLAASNYWAEHIGSDCARYSNHTSTHILAMLAVARLRNDSARFAQAATGAGGKLRIPWTLQVEKNIYGARDRPVDCDANGVYSGGRIYQMPEVAPGEIVDRYRGGPEEALGYPIYSLTDLLLGAEILRNAGYLPLRFHGDKGQSLTLALDYYAYYFTAFLSDKPTVVKPRPGDPYPDEAQYLGHPVSFGGGVDVNGKSDMLLPFLLGYCLDRRDSALAALVAKAMSFAPRIAPFYAGDMIAIDCLAALPAQ